jgi:hypothetical protein
MKALRVIVLETLGLLLLALMLWLMVVTPAGTVGSRTPRKCCPAGKCDCEEDCQCGKTKGLCCDGCTCAISKGGNP